MAKSAAEIRREKLRARQTAAIKNRDKKGLGKKSVLDWSKCPGTKPENFVPEIGEMHLFDILPFEVTQEWYKNLRTKQGNTTGLDVGEWDYKLEIPVHKGVGEDNDIFICLREAFGKKCPICEDMFEEYAKENPDKDKARKLNCSWRDYFNVFDYNGDDDELRIWEDASYALYEKEFLEEAEEGEEIILYTDIEEGRSIEFKGKEDSVGKIKFCIPKKINFVERDPYGEEIIDETISFDALLNIPTYDDVFKAHNAIENDNDDSDKPEPEKEEKEEPKNRSRGRARKPKSSEPEKPKSDPDNPCPCGKEFGYDIDPGSKDCESCSDDIFNDCSDLNEELGKKELEEPEKEEENNSEEIDPPEDNELERDEKNNSAPTRRRTRKAVEKKEEPADAAKPTRRRRR